MKQQLQFFALLSIVTITHGMYEEITQNGIIRTTSTMIENYRSVKYNISATYYPLENRYEASANIKAGPSTIRTVSAPTEMDAKITFDGMKSQFTGPTTETATEALSKK